MRYRSLLSLSTLPLILCILLFIAFRIPSLIEPYWYGDEGIYAVIGQALRDGSLLYRDIWDNKPPILYLLYALVDGNLLYIKTLSVLVGVFSVVMYFLLAKKLFKKEASVVVSTVLFVLLFGLPILEGNIANAENFMLLPITLSAYIVFFKSTVRWIFLAGLLLSVALMTKVVAIFDIAAFFLILFFQHRLHTKSFIETGITLTKNRKIYALITGITVLPFCVFLYYLLRGGIPDLLSSTFTNNVGYVGTHNYLFFPLGLVVLKVSLLVTSLLFLYRVRTKLTEQEVIVFPWMMFALFSMFFSDRPYTHYVLMGIVPFCLLIGSLMERFRIVTLLLVVAIVFMVRIHFPLYQKTDRYYQNYKEYVLEEKSFREYVEFFDKNSLRDYDLAVNLKGILRQGDTVYFWTDSAHLYLLTGVEPITKYIVAYHGIMYEDAMEKILKQVSLSSPQYVVSTTATPVPQDLLRGYTLKYSREYTKIYEKNN